MGDTNYSYRTIGDGSKNVTAAGTAEQLTSAETKCRLVRVQARVANTDNVVIGSSTVVATAGSERGIVLVPGQAENFPVKDVSSLYVDAAVSGEGVSYAYLND